MNKVIEKFKRGKEQSRMLSQLTYGFKLGFVASFFGILISLILILPIVLLVYQTIEVYGYILIANKFLLILCLVLMCLALMFLNGLISLISFLILKSNLREDETVKKVNYSDLFIYEMFNPIFIIFIIIVVVLFGGSLNGKI